VIIKQTVSSPNIMAFGWITRAVSIIEFVEIIQFYFANASRHARWEVGIHCRGWQA
jgi:hypothetical protein